MRWAVADERWALKEVEGALLIELPAEHGGELWLYTWSYGELRRRG